MDEASSFTESAAFPKYAQQQQHFEQRDIAIANSFTKRYEIWLAVHSLMLHEHEQNAATSSQKGLTSPADENAELPDARERENEFVWLR